VSDSSATLTPSLGTYSGKLKKFVADLILSEFEGFEKGKSSKNGFEEEKKVLLGEYVGWRVRRESKGSDNRWLCFE
jgi:hypothetical protein